MNRTVEARASVRSDLEAVRAVMRDPAAVFPRRGPTAGTFLSEVEIDLTDGTVVRQDVVVEIGVPVDGPVPSCTLTWHPAGHERMLPTLDAVLRAEDAPGGDTGLSIAGTYRPPLGILGAALDGVAMHRVARRTVGTFMRHLASAVEAATDRRRSGAWAAIPVATDDLRPGVRGDMPPEHWLG